VTTTIHSKATTNVSSSFERDGNRLTRVLTTPSGTFASSVLCENPTHDDLGDWWLSYLRGQQPTVAKSGFTVSIAELFCGSGGLAQGVKQASYELGHRPVVLAAADHDPEAVSVYERNHHPYIESSRSVTELIDFRVKRRGTTAQFRYEPELLNDEWRNQVGKVDVLLAGPPCQGHSNLNNYSRRDDKRNDLYLSVAAFAVALAAPIVIIENVPAVVHDRLGVVAATTDLLMQAGYQVESGVVKADELGWAQRRSRYFIVARQDVAPLPLSTVCEALRDDARSVDWAIQDLALRPVDEHMFRRPDMSAENLKRISYLFEHDIHDLPSSERPDCHKDGTTYTAVYGRLFGDRPAPTITTGFLTAGRGRFVHPHQPRVLTPAEAARLQGFPDNYNFRSADGAAPSSAKLTKWIGDAVPMPLGFAAGVAALAPGLPGITLP
jgi:DNA (cytosine-5)-methyltransferase 1